MSQTEELATPDAVNGYEIAIVGMAARIPGANRIDEFWQNLRNGTESIYFHSDEELLAAGLVPATLDDPNFVKASSTIRDVDQFDASFFDFTPREAEVTDPQHRLFLECANEALENAGYNSESYEGAIGVYAGTGISSYLLKTVAASQDFFESPNGFEIIMANDKDFLPTRVSYKLNLRGPSVSVNTACSTSLVAIHLACQSLLHGECDMVLAGGVSIGGAFETGYMYQEGMILSPDGHCRAFDAKAQGTVSGSGVGIVVLKRLSEAMSDGDHIYAVIKGSAINNDGNLKAGYTAPSVEGQAEVISEALAMADVSPETVSYVEAHGTGTVLGDPIEMVALTEAYRELGAEANGFCAIGSLKTNVGHLDSAAGVAGLIKTSLALKHKQIPPSLHFEEPNPKIDFANSPFYVNTELQDWPRNGTPRRAGVSSFGIGGTNAHALLEEAPIQQPSGESRPWQLLLLSAKTDTALENATSNLARHLQENPELKLADVAYTLQVGRKALNQRRMLVCQELSDAADLLESRDAQHLLSTTASDAPSDTEPSLVFMFSGQGSQYVNMGRELYESEPVFFEQVNHCADLLKEDLGVDLTQLLYPQAEDVVGATELLRQTAMAQPALFVVEYALAQLWLSWGVYPQAMIGHSIGEYVAACLAGVFSLEDALQLVSLRGRLMQQMPAGSMLALSLPEAEVLPLLGETLSLAAVNGPSMSVVAGESEVIEAFAQEQEQRGVACRTLHTSHAFHSAMMEPMLTPFLEAVSQVELHAPEIPYISNLTGGWIRDEEATDPAYWVQHVRQPVRFSQGLETMIEALADPKAILLEVGPGRSLSTLARQHPQVGTGELLLSSLRHPQDKQSDVAFLLTSLGRLWLAGVDIDWQGFSEHERRHRVPLPTYPFERRRFWIEPPTDSKGNHLNPTQSNETSASGAHPDGTHLNGTSASGTSANEMMEMMAQLTRKPDVADWFYVPTWKSTIVPPKEQKPSLLDGTWLFFVDECGLGDSLIQRLQCQGRELITAQAGSQFSKLDDQTYILNPRQPEDYVELLDELRTDGKEPDQIVHLWTVTPVAPLGMQTITTEPIEWAELMQDRGFYSLLYLAKALGQQNGSKSQSRCLTVVSNNVQEVAGEMTLHPEKATVLGAVKIIPQEYPNIRCRSIDVVLPTVEQERTGKVVDQLLTELSTESNAHIAYRGNQRWQQTIEAVQLPEFQEDSSRLRTGGVYLITGGLSGIGLALAEHLATHYQAKLILVGRSSLPDRSEWEDWLTNHEHEDKTSHKLRKVQEMEALGAEVLACSADVASLEQMKPIIEQAQDRFGAINGVIHSAGIIDYAGVIHNRTRAETDPVLAPKVQGTLVLDALLQNIRLDFFVLCSSLSSILYKWTLGEVGYCAANTFLDAFTHYKTLKDGTFTVAINWDEWQEVGMAATAAEERGNNKQKRSTEGLRTEEGVDVFRRILDQSLPRVAVSTRDLCSMVEHHNSLEITDFSPNFEQVNASRPKHPRPELSSAYAAPQNATEERLAEIWQDLLRIDQVGIHDNFFELGGDSLLIVQLRSKVSDVKDLLIADLFEYPTIHTLAEYLSHDDDESTVEQVHDRAQRQRAAMQQEQIMRQRRRLDE